MDEKNLKLEIDVIKLYADGIKENLRKATNKIIQQGQEIDRLEKEIKRQKKISSDLSDILKSRSPYGFKNLIKTLWIKYKASFK